MGTPSVLIIGAGVAGLCMAMQLRRAGYESFTILEKSDGVGGTWRDNSYPGASCDVPSFLYSFSFETKTDWTRAYAGQAEILAYLEHCADRYRLRPHIRFRTEVAGARFDEGTAQWICRTASGEEVRADVLVTGTGQLNRPSYPEIAGRETFAGTTFHSARWRHELDLAGRRIAVIGNAASAVQFIPRIAPAAAHLSIFQRSANWILPRGDRAYTRLEKALFARIPSLTRLYRYGTWLQYEARWPLFSQRSVLGRLIAMRALRGMRSQVTDASLRQALTPDYPIGCKRILVVDDYYATLRRTNVSLVTSPIERIAPRGVVTSDGRTHEADFIIYATGFESTGLLAPMEVTGTGGRRLQEVWNDGPEAYFGMALSGFPNFFMLYGPNTNLGHNSIILMIECQVRYIMQMLEALGQGRARYVDVPAETLARYNDELQRRLDRLVWTAGCRNWYRTSSGKVVNNWPYSTMAYWWRTRRPDWRALGLEAARG
jgi:cation diffusion facilitator CzcD-associated flavoprotein CzcO